MTRLNSLKHDALKFVFCRVLRARWIVDSEGCLGLRIAGVNLIYYKWPDPTVSTDEGWRFAKKREFGESIRSTMEVTERRLSVLEESDLMGLPNLD